MKPKSKQRSRLIKKNGRYIVVMPPGLIITDADINAAEAPNAETMAAITDRENDVSFDSADEAIDFLRGRPTESSRT